MNKRIVVIFLFALNVFTLHAQHKDALTSKSKDTVVKLDSSNLGELQNIQSAQQSDTLIPFLVNKVGRYTVQLHQSSTVMQRMIDMSSVYRHIMPIDKIVTRMRQRIDSGKFKLNIRSISTSLILLSETQEELASDKDNINTYYNKTYASNQNVQRILKDPVWLILPYLSTDLAAQLQSLRDESLTLDKQQNETLARLNLARNRLSVIDLKLNDLTSDLNFMKMNMNIDMWSQEEPFLWKISPKNYSQSVAENVSSSLSRSQRINYIYLSHKWGITAWGIILLLLIIFWTRSNVKKIADDNLVKNTMPVRMFRRSAILCSVYLFTFYILFFYMEPPASLGHTIELIRFIVLSILISPMLPARNEKYWYLILLLWLYYALDDLILEPSWGDRWLLFIASAALIFINLNTIRAPKDKFKELPFAGSVRAISIVSIFLSIFSFFFNIFGRVTLARLFGVSAIETLVTGFALNFLCMVILGAIYIQTESHKSSRFSSFINYEERNKQYKFWIFIVCLIIWVGNFVKSMAMEDPFQHLLSIIFTRPITIGKISFTLGAVVIFCGVVWISAVISRFVNFILKDESEANANKRNKLGSMALLVRLGIWILGFLIAVAAAGIPLDKVTLIIGGLGVGIGFGLQNIANNLVSGIILAFERPFQIGDQIDIGSKSGVVKEIGVRSSKLKNVEGADIIVPNGDMLSQQLVNWTMQNRNKRVEFNVRVAYGVDLYAVQQMLYTVLHQQEEILQLPAPLVIVNEFASSAITVKVLCWVPDLVSAPIVRSAVMLQSYKALKDAGVEIPIDTSASD